MLIDKRQHEIKKIYLSCDLCIGSAGISIWDRINLGLPNIVVNPNFQQSHLAEYLKTKKIVKVIDVRNNYLTMAEKMIIIKFLKNPIERYKMIKLGLELIDGNGLSRVLNFIQNEKL